MAVSVGIDLGTTYSVVAIIDPQTRLPKIVPNNEGSKITPSIIQFIDGEPRYGSEAERAFRAGEPFCAATFKRNMGDNEPLINIDDKTYNAEDLSSLLLQHIKEETEAVLRDTIADAVITVPAYFTTIQKEATIRAAGTASLKVKQLIDEPNAAALAYGVSHWRENANILVYDLGGGTFDVTLVGMIGNGELRTITTNGNHMLGGRDWDDRIEDLLHTKFSEETDMETRNDTITVSTIRGLAEEAKKSLSKMPTVKIATNFPKVGKIDVIITQSEFNERSADLIERTGDLCSAVLDEAGLSFYDVTDVLLVGGSTRMPQVKQYLTKMFGKEPISHVNPDEAVALGAAIQSTKARPADETLTVIKKKDGTIATDILKISGGKKSYEVQAERSLDDINMLRIKPSIAHAMGVVAISRDGKRYINKVIIPANHPYPVRVAKKFAFYSSEKKANELKVYVLQGDKEKPLECEIHPEMYIFTGIRHIEEQRGKTTIRVQYRYDHNGIIHVNARQENDNFDLPFRRERSEKDDLLKFGRPVEQDEEEITLEMLSVVLAVDVSGSMYGTPLSDAQDAMCKFVKQMNMEYARVGIVAVSDRSEIVCNLTNNENEIISAIHSITCGQTGIENEGHPFDTIKIMLERENGRKFAIVLADGVWENQPEAVRKSKICNQAKIETAAIGFGKADKKFLKDISSSDANAVYVSGSSELTRTFNGFAQILSEPSGKGSKTEKESTESDSETWVSDNEIE